MHGFARVHPLRPSMLSITSSGEVDIELL